MNFSYQTLQLRDQPGVRFMVLSRASAKNSLNSVLVTELRAALAGAERDAAIRVVVLEGNATHFCTGMDFQAVAHGENDLMADDPGSYCELLKEISSGTKVVISKVEGQVNAGGVGLVAASDIVISSKGATFGLSEMLFGLLPACVLPFLIRRIGFQKAHWMTLITQGISAQRALEIGLVDELGENISDLLRRNLLRLTRLEPETIGNLKAYMSKLWIMDDQTRDPISQYRSYKVAILIGYDNYSCCGGSKEELLAIHNKEKGFNDLQFFTFIRKSKSELITYSANECLDN